MKQEETLIQEEEFTTCPVHPSVMVEYFTDCPRCMEEDMGRDAHEEQAPISNSHSECVECTDLVPNTDYNEASQLCGWCQAVNDGPYGDNAF